MKKQILITNGHLRIGGVEKSLVNFLNAIDYSKYDVDLLLFEGTGEYIAEVPEEVNVILCDLTSTYGSLVEVMKKSFPNLAVIWRKFILTLANRFDQRLLKYLIRTKEYDVALAYRIGTPMDYVSYGVKAKRKYFWWHHGAFAYPDSLIRHWQESAQQMTGMVCVSKSVKEIVKSYFEPYVKEITVIPNMITTHEPIAVMDHEQENNELYTIVSVGRFSEEKHMCDCVISAKELVNRGYRRLRWYLIGDGPEKDKINNEIISAHLQNIVVCLGNITNPYPYMKNADLIVHPSHVESQGMTVLEAMALKKLIVAAGSEGVKEYAIDHENALITEMSINSLVNKIEVAINMNENDRIMICEAAKKTADKYRPDAIMKQIERDLFLD